jgi:hypothetical protein
MPARYVRPYSKGQKNDFRDAEAHRHHQSNPRLPVGARHDWTRLRYP